jgi:hypothetical protein
MSPAAHRRRPSVPVRAFCAAALFATLCLAGASPAAAWEVRGDAPKQAFDDFHARFSMTAYHFPRREAASLGLAGFEIYADAALDRDFDEESFYPLVVDGDLPGGTMAVSRVGVRKGLPFNLDLGVSYGWALDGDVELISADVLWAFVDGGLVSPALALRVTGTRTTGSGRYDLEQYGAELMISKSFPVLTLYGGAGVYDSDGTLQRTGGGEWSSNDSGTVYYAGAVINLVILPKLTVEAEQGDHFQAAVKLGIGF